ncbi:hypothetical protein C7999DRAFT_42631 [Corynascus novoguineensis]|uniref:NmrA-like domain-containing protein n=1 Tax=Corynascus novoguineensis TaxID=1126955 RepID=A0AAN7CR46_9PEZI|nr:hypothetical protein C7999DRAFT_42631 [Corynascus novoguineensis]
MVKIAIVGPGQLACAIIDGLVATGKHEIVVLSRRAAPENVQKGTTWVKVDYTDKQSLVQALDGVHTVLSFVLVMTEDDAFAQKNLIDAAIEAGVKRIAPSEWAVANFKHLTWYNAKLAIRDYLREKNKEGKVIEYTFFQPGWFMNYLGGAHQTSKHFKTAVLLVNHDKGRIGIAGDPSSLVTYTAIHDIVNIVVKAIDYEGEWPEVGGINGHTLSVADEVAIGERVRGKKYQVEKISIDDAKAGKIDDSWLPDLDWPGLAHVPESQRLAFARIFLSGLLLNLAEGGATVSDEWNRIFPDYKFTKVDEFLTGVYTEKV